jgi:hypothetical protein
MEQPDVNHRYVKELTNLMFQKVGHFSNRLDDYASYLFERPIRGSWRIFVHIAKHGEPDYMGGNPWWWDNFSENPHYPRSPLIETLDVFASSYLHEVAHGWLYLLSDYERGEKLLAATGHYITTRGNRDEEELCEEISRLVCEMLDLQFHEHREPGGPQ